MVARESEEDDEEYEVELITRKKQTENGEVLYKVRWAGFGAIDDTLELEQELGNAADKVAQYNHSWKPSTYVSRIRAPHIAVYGPVFDRI